ncbi:MAG: hypothetical protein HY912_12750 [Desulfomonile tiedjei]|uniref:Uncharacterized protein n=1 Tax=Desulfomonile tiedjei TaxID=2358 RepID=A0A9D6V1J2_9BACT|nr:hypothetical protein [Desulfomonile tiedjei]
MPPLYEILDPYLIWLYHITGYSFPDFLLGTFVLALLTVMIGEFTISLVFLINRRYIDEQTNEILRYQNLSVDALAAGNKEAYIASNKMANEAFGKSFFMQIAMSAAFLWPIFFVLTWMQFRFGEVDFRILFTEHSVGFACVFVALYAAAYMVFKRIKRRIPYFRRINEILDTYRKRTTEMKTLADIATKKPQSA